MKTRFVLALLAITQFAVADDTLTGTWLNVDSKSGGVTRILIKSTPTGLAVTTYGKCSPVDCVWGETTLTPTSATTFSFGYVNSHGVLNFNATQIDSTTLNLTLTKPTSSDSPPETITLNKAPSGPNIYIKL